MSPAVKRQKYYVVHRKVLEKLHVTGNLDWRFSSPVSICVYLFKAF